MDAELIADFPLTFSYNQLYVGNIPLTSEQMEAPPAYYKQGFVRFKNFVLFTTPVQSGTAHIKVFNGAFEDIMNANRIISVPFEITTGKAAVFEPNGSGYSETFNLKIGHYWLTMAQKLHGDLAVVFHFERVNRSREKCVIVKHEGELEVHPLLEVYIPKQQSRSAGNWNLIKALVKTEWNKIFGRRKK